MRLIIRGSDLRESRGNLLHHSDFGALRTFCGSLCRMFLRRTPLPCGDLKIS